MARTKQVARNSGSSRPPKPEVAVNQDGSESRGRRGDGGASRVDAVTSRHVEGISASNEREAPSAVSVKTAVTNDSRAPSLPSSSYTNSQSHPCTNPDSHQNALSPLANSNFQSSGICNFNPSALSERNFQTSNHNSDDYNRTNSGDNHYNRNADYYNRTNSRDNHHNADDYYRYSSRDGYHDSRRSNYDDRNYHTNNARHNSRRSHGYDSHRQDNEHFSRDRHRGNEYNRSRRHYDDRDRRYDRPREDDRWEDRRPYSRDGYKQYRGYQSRRSDRSPPRQYQDSRNVRPRYESARNREPVFDDLLIERDMQRLKTEQKEAELRELDLESARIGKELEIEEKKRRLEKLRMDQPVAGAAARGSVDAGNIGSSFAAAAAGNTDSDDEVTDTTAAAARGVTLSADVAKKDDSGDEEELFGDSDAEPAVANPSFASQADVLVDSNDELESRAGANRMNKEVNGKKASEEQSNANAAGSTEAVEQTVTEEVDSEVEENGINVPYTEKSLMTIYTPEIIDHSFITNKFLVKWNKSNGSLSEFPCRSWVHFEAFVFPALAQAYISKLIESGNYNSEKKILADKKRQFAQTEADDCEKNEIKNFSVEDGLHLAEIDFCCFICSCVNKNGRRDGKSTKEQKTPGPKAKKVLITQLLETCMYGLKFHRPCCHGFRTAEELKSKGLISAVGQAQMEISSPSRPVHVPKITKDDMVVVKPSAVTVSNDQNLVNLNQLKGPKGKAVILSINTGVGSVAVAVKQLGLDTKRIIHVESDPVARHSICYHHDYKYGETLIDDGIDHVVGLYNSFDELCIDPFDLVTRFGPIDLILYKSSGKNKDEHKSHAKQFFTFCDNVRTFNRDIKGHESLLYLLDTHPSVKSENHDSRCNYDTNHVFICNWPLEASSLRGVKSSHPNAHVTMEQKLGFPQKYTMKSVSSLFKALKKAYTVSIEEGELKWSCEVHPKFWIFLSLGPKGHGFKIDPHFDLEARDSAPIDAMLLEIREPESSKLLLDSDYAQVLLRRSMSVHWLVEMLKPLSGFFEKKHYRGVTSRAEAIPSLNTNTNQHQEGEKQDPCGGKSVTVGEYDASTDEEPLESLLGGNKPLSFDL